MMSPIVPSEVMPQAGTLGGAAGNRAVNKQAVFDRQPIAPFGQILNTGQRCAELWPANFAVLQKLRNDTLCCIDRNCEADADAAARGRQDLRIDADHAAKLIEQRPTRISGIDRCVSLNSGVDRAAVPCTDRTLKPGDDAGGQCAVETERIADRKNLLPDGKLFRIAKRDDGQPGRRESILITARSVSGSPPMTFAGYTLSPPKFTVSFWAPSMTW